MTDTAMSHADVAWLHMDRPTNLMVITAVLLFDEPVDWERLVEIIQTRLADRFPRFRQRVEEGRAPLRSPRFVDHRAFAIEQHVHRRALPPPGDDAALQELIGALMMMPLDRRLPLWQCYLVEDVGDGAALIVRMHHCIADGVALARVMLSLADDGNDDGLGPVARHEAEPAGLAGLAVRGALAAARLTVTVPRIQREVTSPSRAIRRAAALARDAATITKLVLTPPDTVNALHVAPGVSRQVAWTERLPLSEVKLIARWNEATVNDVLLAAVTGALRRYLLETGHHPDELTAMVPFNLRGSRELVPRELGNRFGLVLLELPIATGEADERLAAVHERMRRIKDGRDGPVSYGLLSAAGLLGEEAERRAVDFLSNKATAVLTNVPGPRRPVYLAGVAISTAFVWAPTSGQIGISVSIFSYDDQVTIGLMVDPILVPDPGRIATLIESELDVLAHLQDPPSVTR